MAFCLSIPVQLFAGTGPSWWYNPTLTTSGTTPVVSGGTNDYSAGNQGQLKNMAVTGVNELNAGLSQFGGAGATLNGLAVSLTATSGSTSDYAAVNLGQLKAVIQPFFDRLLAIGYTGTSGLLSTGTYPWIYSGASPQDYSMASVGQIKYMFSFDPTFESNPANLLPDWWQLNYFGMLGISGTNLSPSGNGYTDFQEYQMGWNPYDYYHGVPPLLTKEAGDNQFGIVSQFAPEPLVVQVTDTNGVPLNNAPIAFSVTTGGGSIASSATSTLVTSISLNTGTNGTAGVYYREPSSSGTGTVTVTATTGTLSSQVVFTEVTGTIPVPSVGLVLWLEANVGISGTTGTPIANWPDESGSGNNATQSTGSNQPTLVNNAVNGLPVVQFNGSSDSLSLPSFLTSETSGEIFAVLKSATGSGVNAGLWQFGNYGGNSSTISSTLYPNSAGHLMGDFGIAGASSPPPFDQGVPFQDITQFHIYEANAQSNLWESWINGLPLFESQSNSVGFTTLPTIGADHNSHYFDGDLAEVIVYGRTLSASERQSVIGYLAQKYTLFPTPATPSGVVAFALNATAALLTWNAPTASCATNYQVWRNNGSSGWTLVGTVANGGTYIDNGLTEGASYSYKVLGVNGSGIGAFSSVAVLRRGEVGVDNIPVSGMQLWLMADGAWNNAVAYWHDYSGQGNDGWVGSTAAAPTTYPAVVANSINGRPAVHFTETSMQDFNFPTLSLSGSAAEVLVVIRTGTNGTRQGLWNFGSYGFGELYPENTGELFGQFGSSNQLYNQGVPTQDIGQFHIYEVNSQAGSWQTWMDGLPLYPVVGSQIPTSTANSVGFAPAPHLGYSSIQNPSYFNGDIAEMIVYNRSLTNDERASLHQYLAVKYLLPNFDVDGDGLTTAEDIALGLDPLNPDVNGDGLVNGLTQTIGLSATNFYIVGNGLTNAQNIARGVDVFNYVPPPPDPSPTSPPSIILTSPANAVLVP